MAVKLYANVNVMEVGDLDFAEGYTLYDARYVLKDGDTMTGALLIEGSANTAQLQVRGASGQSANLQTWEDDSGNVLTQIQSDGALRIGTTYGDQTIKMGLNETHPVEIQHSALGGTELVHMEATKYVAVTNSDTHYAFNARMQINVSATKTTGGAVGFGALVRNDGAGTTQSLIGASFVVQEQGGGIIYDAVGLAASVNMATGSAQRAYGIRIADLLGNIDDAYGIYLPDITAGGTKNYSLYTQRGDVALMSNAADKIGFHGATPVAQQTVTGSRGGNAALASLLTKLANLGIVVDAST